MKKFVITEEEKNSILAQHKMLMEAKMETVSDLEKEIERLEKKLEELKSKQKKKETNEDSFDDLLNADIDVEDERDSLEQA